MSGFCDILMFTSYLALAAAATQPLILWTSRDLNITSTLGATLHYDDLRQQVSNKIFAALPGTNVALFVQPGLNFPDLLSYGGDGVLSNLRRFVTPENHGISIDLVRDPLSAFRGLPDGVRLVRVRRPDEIEGELEKSDPNFVNVFEISLSEPTPDNPSGGLRANDVIIGDVMRKIQRINHPFVGVLIGETPEGEGEEEPSVHVVKKRAAQSSGTALKDEPSMNLWESDCIKAYFGTITIKVMKGKDLINEFSLTVQPTVSSNCTKQPKEIIASYKINDTCTVTIRLEVRNYKSYWKLVKVNAKIDKCPTNVTVTNDLEPTVDAWASNKFSFHCSAAMKEFEPKDRPKDQERVSLEIKKFQIQGSMTSSTAPFGEAFDCVGFFSMPILIGLLTTLLLIVFTTLAVVAMASIRTPERFDDPKGERISVPNE